MQQSSLIWFTTTGSRDAFCLAKDIVRVDEIFHTLCKVNGRGLLILLKHGWKGAIEREKERENLSNNVTGFFSLACLLCVREWNESVHTLPCKFKNITKH